MLAIDKPEWGIAMNEHAGQAMAVAQNLGLLARLHADSQQYETALALYDNALNWAMKAEDLPQSLQMIEHLKRERALIRQAEALAQAVAAVAGS